MPPVRLVRLSSRVRVVRNRLGEIGFAFHAALIATERRGVVAARTMSVRALAGVDVRSLALSFGDRLVLQCATVRKAERPWLARIDLVDRAEVLGRAQVILPAG